MRTPFIILAVRPDGTEFVVPAHSLTLHGACVAAEEMLNDPRSPLIRTEVAVNPFASRGLRVFEPASVRRVA